MNIMEKYFKESEDNPTTLAARMDRSPSTITRVLRGEREPSFALAADIEKGTKGKVKATDFLIACYRAWNRREKEAA